MRARGADSQQPGGGARNRHRAVLVAAVVVGCAGLVSGVSASTGSDDELQEVDAVTSTERPEANALSRGAPEGAVVLPALPVQVARPQPATPAVISGLADNGIPNVALNAYRVAAARLASALPSCGIDWSLLAGIGRVESNHGRYGGAVLNADGAARPKILGPALNGVDFAFIGDSDGGRWDGDAAYDRAMGPMQFIPTTWRAYAVDADGDGGTDPFDIDDAALAAGNYLCTAGGDLRTAAGQRRAVFAYNHSDSYVNQVLALARAYADGIPVDDLPLSGDTTGAVPAPDWTGIPAAPGPAIGAADDTTSPRATTTGAAPASRRSGSGSSSGGDEPSDTGSSSGGGSTDGTSSGGGDPAAPPPADDDPAPAPAPEPAPGPEPTPTSAAPALPAPSIPSA